MLTVLSVKFKESKSPKIYDYLLDPRSVVKPKLGDILKIFRGTSSWGTSFVEIEIMAIGQTSYLPINVLNVLRVEKDMITSNHRLSAASLSRLREPPEKKMVKKVTASTPPQKPVHKWTSRFTPEELVEWATTRIKL